MDGVIGGMTIYKDVELKTYLGRRAFTMCRYTKESWLCITAEMRGLNHEYLCIYLTQRIKGASGAKKAFALPEDALRREIEKQNRHRGIFTPTDRKAYYETIAVNGFPCLIVREHPKPSERAILYFFGGGMVIGPDKGDLPVMRKLCRETGCDVWFPFYPLCMEHCITETYAMVYECYRK